MAEQNCQCQSAAHGHRPGRCPYPPVDDGLCKECNEENRVAEADPYGAAGARSNRTDRSSACWEMCRKRLAMRANARPRMGLGYCSFFPGVAWVLKLRRRPSNNVSTVGVGR